MPPERPQYCREAGKDVSKVGAVAARNRLGQLMVDAGGLFGRGKVLNADGLLLRVMQWPRSKS